MQSHEDYSSHSGFALGQRTQDVAISSEYIFQSVFHKIPSPDGHKENNHNIEIQLVVKLPFVL